MTPAPRRTPCRHKNVSVGWILGGRIVPGSWGMICPKTSQWPRTSLMLADQVSGQVEAPSRCRWAKKEKPDLSEHWNKFIAWATVELTANNQKPDLGGGGRCSLTELITPLQNKYWFTVEQRRLQPTWQHFWRGWAHEESSTHWLRHWWEIAEGVSGWGGGEGAEGGSESRPGGAAEVCGSRRGTGQLPDRLTETSLRRRQPREHPTKSTCPIWMGTWNWWQTC